MTARPLLLLVLASGCAADERPGQLEVSWSVGQQSCAELGLESVVAELFDFGGPEPLRQTEADCEARRATLARVPVGAYTLRLRGVDEGGCWTHTARRDDVRVSDAESERVEDLPLVRRTRPTRVLWRFADGEDCARNGIEQVSVTARYADGTTRSWGFVCYGLGQSIDDLERGNLTLEVVAFDAGGIARADGAVELVPEDFVESPCDDEVAVEVPLSDCLVAGCESL